MNVRSVPRSRHATELALAEAPSGQRQLRKLATLSALRQAALDLVSEHGLDPITVNDIATAAGVSRRTFFNYFATKEDALVGENPQLATVLYEAITARPSHETPLSAVHAGLIETATAVVTPGLRERIRTRHQLLGAHPELLGRHLARYTSFEHLLEQAISYRAAACAEGAATDARLLATLVSSAVRLCIQRWAEHDETSLVEELDAVFSDSFTRQGVLCSCVRR